MEKLVNHPQLAGWKFGTTKTVRLVWARAAASVAAARNERREIQLESGMHSSLGLRAAKTLVQGAGQPRIFPRSIARGNDVGDRNIGHEMLRRSDGEAAVR